MAESIDTPNDLWLEAQARYEDARDHASKWRKQARECFAFYAGDQWSSDDRQKLEEQQRPVVTFNRTKRLIDAVIGHEANNRAEVRYIPRTQGDAKVNTLLTNASQYFRDQCDAEFEESDAFRDTLVCGMGWTHDRLTDDRNPEYDLIEERVDPMEMLWDPAAKKPNLADGRYLFRRKRYTKKEIRNIWPDFDGPFTGGFDDEEEDETQPHETNPRSAYQEGDDHHDDVRQDALVVEYQYKERQSFYSITEVNSDTGQPSSFDLPADEDPALIERLKKSGVPMALKRRTVVKRCFIIGRNIVQGPEVIYPGGFTYHCITGFRDRENNRWFGIVLPLLDPQRWSNKWLAQIMYILNSNAKGGLMMEVDAVEDMNQFKDSWADPAAPAVFASGALKDGRVVPKPPPVFPVGIDKLLQYANDSFSEVSGVNQELLGLADREQPGVLEWQRKQSAVTLLAPVFDSLRRFRKMQGRCWLYMMQKYVSDGRMVRITTDEGEFNVPFGGPGAPAWQDAETAEYDVIVDQAATAPNQKEQTWSVISQLLPMVGDAMPPQAMMLALEYSPLPASFVEKLKQMQKEMESKPPPPDPEMMKAQAQIEAMERQAQIKEREAQVNLWIKQQEGQMNLALKEREMELKEREAELDFRIAQQKAEQQMLLAQQQAQQKMQLGQQQAAFDAQRMQQDAMLDQQRAQMDMAREDEQFERQNARDDEASAAKIKREDRSARAKARRQPKQPEQSA